MRAVAKLTFRCPKCASAIECLHYGDQEVQRRRTSRSRPRTPKSPQEILWSVVCPQEPCGWDNDGNLMAGRRAESIKFLTDKDREAIRTANRAAMGVDRAINLRR